MRVFVTGGTGTIGRAIVAALAARGDVALVLSRGGGRAREVFGAQGDAVQVIEGDPTAEGAWQAQVAGCDAVVNLAGESIAGRRWNAQVRQILRDSRMDATREVVRSIAATPPERRPRVLVNASGVDYYALDMDPGRRGGEAELDPADEVGESAPAGSGFLARLCHDWEAEALEAEKLAVRVVVMRTGVVVAGTGGPLAKWARAFRWFAGGRIGSGRQWMSWVHIDDAAGAYLFAIDTPSLAGPVNLVAPTPLRNRDFARQLGRALKRPSLLPTPAPLLRLAVGNLAEHLLGGRPAVPRALLGAGYTFRHTSPFVPP